MRAIPRDHGVRGKEKDKDKEQKQKLKIRKGGEGIKEKQSQYNFRCYYVLLAIYMSLQYAQCFMVL